MFNPFLLLVSVTNSSADPLSVSTAEEYLSFAFEHCHRSSQKNKRMILIYLLPVKMLLVSGLALYFQISHCGTNDQADTHYGMTSPDFYSEAVWSPIQMQESAHADLVWSRPRNTVCQALT